MKKLVTIIGIVSSLFLFAGCKTFKGVVRGETPRHTLTDKEKNVLSNAHPEQKFYTVDIVLPGGKDTTVHAIGMKKKLYQKSRVATSPNFNNGVYAFDF